MAPDLRVVVLAGVMASLISVRAEAACTVAQELPADGAVAVSNPTFTWSGSGCTSYRLLFSPSCAFDDVVATNWQGSRSFQFGEIGWESLQTGGGEDGVCWRVQGQVGGTKTTTGSRLLFVDGNAGAGDADAFLVGESGFDWAGTAVAWIGDIDQDGNDDLLVGAPYDDDGGADAGAAYLFYGPIVGDVDLANADAKILGEAAGDIAGAAVSRGGDVNGDGFPDYLIGAYGADLGAGVAYLLTEPVFGTVDLADVANTIDGARMEGERLGDNAGASLEPAGDLDGDGFDDVLIGAPSRDEGAGSPTTGAMYVLYGPLSGTVPLGCTFDGSCDGAVTLFTGSAMNAVGDVDGDGFGDLLVGTPGFNPTLAGYDSIGVARLVLGPFSGEFELSNATAEAQFFGAGADDGAGSAVASADFDGDDVTDFLVGAAGAGTGTLSIFFGPRSGDFDLTDADVTITAETSGAFGSTLAVGDIDGDGELDLAVGAPNTDTNFGAAYVFAGPFAVGAFTTASADLQLAGEWDTFFGNDVALGDGDGDGTLDLLVGIVGDSTGGFRAGAAAIYEAPLP